MKEKQSNKYDDIEIKLTKWPELTQTPEGAWIRVWDIVFERPLSTTKNLEQISQALSYEDYHVHMEEHQPNQLVVSVVTQAWGWETKVWSATFLLFDKIEQHLGEIKTIQGQERNIWKR